MTKESIKELERLKQEYHKNSDRFHNNNERIESFLKAIISREERCLICGENLEFQYEDGIRRDIEIKNHEFGTDGHKFIKGFKNDIVQQTYSLLEITNRVSIGIKDFELWFYGEYSNTSLINAWNEQSDSGTYYFRRYILEIFKAGNVVVMLENLKKEIITETKSRNRYVKETTETVNTIDKMIHALGEI